MYCAARRMVRARYLDGVASQQNDRRGDRRCRQRDAGVIESKRPDGEPGGGSAAADGNARPSAKRHSEVRDARDQQLAERAEAS